jgi:hypothetical protein
MLVYRSGATSLVGLLSLPNIFMPQATHFSRVFVQDVGQGQIVPAVGSHHSSTPFPNDSGLYLWMKTIAQ